MAPKKIWREHSPSSEPNPGAKETACTYLPPKISAVPKLQYYLRCVLESGEEGHIDKWASSIS